MGKISNERSLLEKQARQAVNAAKEKHDRLAAEKERIRNKHAGLDVPTGSGPTAAERSRCHIDVVDNCWFSLTGTRRVGCEYGIESCLMDRVKSGKFDGQIVNNSACFQMCQARLKQNGGSKQVG